MKQIRTTIKIITAISLISSAILAGCGGGSGDNYGSVSFSTEFQEWLNSLPESHENFPEFWRSQANDWQYWEWTAEEYQQHKNDTPEQIFYSKKINCHRATNLLLAKYEGEYLLIPQPGFDHAVLKGQDSSGIWYISFSGLKVKFTREYHEIFEEYTKRRKF